jgi:hypothetical protein
MRVGALGIGIGIGYPVSGIGNGRRGIPNLVSGIGIGIKGEPDCDPEGLRAMPALTS